jgi:FtsP/CotA-like multicopper oxidase with cupredoxin domain
MTNREPSHVTRYSRREVLQRTGIAAAAWALSRDRSGFALPARRDGGASCDVTLRASPAEVPFVPDGRPSRVLRFEGKVVGGPSDALVPAAGYLGPTFRVRRGDRVRVRFENALDEASIVHWHGLAVSPENDGHPRFAVAAGEHYRYDFVVDNRPGLYWYHPHPHGRTGPQVYAGLAGLFLVTDPDDEARGLPAGEHDLALVIQDRALSDDGELVYEPNSMLGFLGDRIFVNGRAEPSFAVDAGTYRLRILNGSNARIYKLAFSDGRPLTVIGSDGGLLAAPVRKPFVALGPGERVELWADFAPAPSGGEVWLESQAFSAGSGMMGGMGGMGMGMGGGGGRLPNGSHFRVCRFDVHKGGRRLRLPPRFEALAWRPEREVVNLGRPRAFDVSMGMMRWVLNGRPFEMMEVAENERVKLDATEDWVFRNDGGMMAMPHPIHVHGCQFQIVERVAAPEARAMVDTLRPGLVDEGWKDTFLLLPGERVRVRVRFERHAGLFLYHCHNLEHEDAGMMRNLLVEG